jgi:hypothetical protein
VFRHPAYAWAAESLCAEVLWLLGSVGEQLFDHVTPAPPDDASVPDVPGGYVQMRSGWERESHQLVLGVGWSGGARRAGGDLLSIQCSAFGQPVVVDPDITGSAGHREWEEFVRHTSTRSTVLVDGLTPGSLKSDRLTPFRGAPRVVLRQWCRNERFELADAYHDWYRCLPYPVVHRRRVLFVKRAYWIVIDDLQGTGRHSVDLVFQTAGHEVDVEEASWAKVWTSSGPGLAIKPFAAIALRPEIADSTAQAAGPAAQPGPAQAAKLLRYRTDADVPFRVVTLLFPLRDRQDAVPKVVPFMDADGSLSGLTIGDPAATILYSDQSVTVEAA